MFEKQNCMKTLVKRSVLVVLMLAAPGLRAQIPDFTPPTPLFRAVMRNDTNEVKRLLDAGSDPNEALFQGLKPIFFAVMNQNLEMLRAMVTKGADLRALDRSGSTTLMWAAFSEDAKTDMVQELLRSGVDPHIKNKAGENALTWALRRGYTPVVELLMKEGGLSDAPMIQASVERAVSLLQRSGSRFVRDSGCTSCHHQALPQMAVGMARKRGFSVDDAISKEQVNAVTRMFEPYRELMLQGTERMPDPTISVSYALMGLSAEGYKPDALTKAMAHLLSTQQRSDGSFRALPVRPPLESNDFTATALCIRSLQLYDDDPDASVARARVWLEAAQPVGNEDRTMQLLGLTWAKAGPDVLHKAASALLKQQRPDGGWAQLPDLETDAYATGQALVALASSGQIEVTDPAYKRGVAYLLRTQLADGSWHVRTRTYPVQPHRETGFPHGKDQFISAAGTSWASIALTFTAANLNPVDGDFTAD